MKLRMFNLDNYKPYKCYPTYKDLELNMIEENGINTILFDIDNTLERYATPTPSEDTKKYFEFVKRLGISIYIISNNSKKRVSHFCESLGVNYLYRTHKPFIIKAKKFINNNGIDLSKTVLVGDQLVSDTLFSNKLGIKNILVKPINYDDEKWYTRVHRHWEKKILKKMKLKDEEKFNQIRSIR